MPSLAVLGFAFAVSLITGLILRHGAGVARDTFRSG